LPAEELECPLRPGFVAVSFEGEEASAAVMAERLVFTLEIWSAAMAGEPAPEKAAGDLARRFERAARDFARLAHRIHDRGAFDDAFVDALCEPPESFTYGSVLAHVLAYGAVRREALAGVLAELGAQVPRDSADPILWEQRRASPRA
jgi:AraC family transcriptional regulator